MLKILDDEHAELELFGTKFGKVTNESDVPGALLDAFIDRFEYGKNFLVRFGTDDFGFGFLEWNNRLYYLADTGIYETPLYTCKVREEAGKKAPANEMLLKLAGELLDDISENMHLWCKWPKDISTPYEARSYRVELWWKIGRLQALVNAVKESRKIS